MITENTPNCPCCAGKLNYYDKVPRIIRAKRRITRWIEIRRFKCISCGKLHRELPDFIFPYKQYDADIIRGVLEGYITSDTIGYEDYPCEAIMDKWNREKYTPYYEN